MNEDVNRIRKDNAKALVKEMHPHKRKKPPNQYDSEASK